jgi:apoptosis-inducing factor 2
MKVVIVGGGFCGALIAKHLESNKTISVTLIDKKPYFEYIPGAIFCITHPEYVKHLRISYHRFLVHTTCITDEIKNITDTTVITKNQTIPFDYAVICTGSHYPIFLKSKTNVYRVHNCTEAIRVSKKIADASRVLIVGGGYIGVEACGQLATQHKDLSITLVDVESRLLSRSPPQASRYANKFLVHHNVKIIHNQKVVDHPKPTQYILSDGSSIDTDVCIWCAGIQVDTSFLEPLGPNSVDSAGRIQVNTYLQMKYHPHIFAGGDICGFAEEKTAFHAESHAKTIASNIVSLSNNQPLTPYQKKFSIQLISLGEYSGIVHSNNNAMYFGLFGVGKKLIQYYTIARLRNQVL